MRQRPGWRAGTLERCSAYSLGPCVLVRAPMRGSLKFRGTLLHPSRDGKGQRAQCELETEDKLPV